MRFPKGTLNIATKPIGEKHGLTQTCNGTAGTSRIENGSTFLGRPNRVGTQRADRILAVPWNVGSTKGILL